MILKIVIARISHEVTIKTLFRKHTKIVVINFRELYKNISFLTAIFSGWDG